MLAHGQDVAVRIFKPRDFSAAGCIPDSELLILDKRVFLEDNTSFFKPSDDRFDVLYFPAEYGVRRGLEVLSFRNSNHCAVGFHHQGIRVIAHEFKPQPVLVKSPGRLASVVGTKPMTLLAASMLPPDSSCIRLLALAAGDFSRYCDN